MTRIHGHLGELIQGRLGPEGRLALVTLPSPRLYVEVMTIGELAAPERMPRVSAGRGHATLDSVIVDADENACPEIESAALPSDVVRHRFVAGDTTSHSAPPLLVQNHQTTELPSPAVSPKTDRVVDPRLAALLTRLGPLPHQRLELSFHLPIGAGAGASTAALIAVAKHLRPDLDQPELEGLAHAIEGASDPLLRPSPQRLLWASREGTAIAPLAPPPPCVIVGGFVAGHVPTDPKDLDFPDISALVAGWTTACDSLEGFGALVTTSAVATLKRRGGGSPEDLHALAQRLGAKGFGIAHTGTARAFLLPPDSDPAPALAVLRGLGWRFTHHFALSSKGQSNVR